MRAIKTSVISILAIGLLAGSAVGVAAQEEETAAEPGTPAKVTGTINGEAGDLVQPPTETVVDGTLEVRGGIAGGDRFEMDDPRLTGTVTVAFNVDVHKESDFIDVVPAALALRLENEAGSWSGQGTGVSHGGGGIPQDEALRLDTWVLTGAGAYEGLSAILIVDPTEDPPTVEGVIFAGGMPPFPELPAESAGALAAGHSETVVAFDPEAFQFSEGVAVDEDGNVYASLSPLGQLVRIAPGADMAETVGSVEGIGEGDNGLLGLAVGPDGAVYGALMSQNPDANGVWRFDPATGAAERVAGTEAIAFPNDQSFGDDGTMYVTSTTAGTVWRVPEGGSAEPWIGDPLLKGTGEAGFGIALGANGIEVVGDTVYVGVSETAQVVAIPINDDGTAGTPTTFVQYDSPVDGVAVDAAGNVYTTHPFANEVRRVNADGDIEVIANVDDDLDGPTSVAIGPGAEGETAYIASFTGALLGGELVIGPSIVSVPTGGE